VHIVLEHSVVALSEVCIIRLIFRYFSRYNGGGPNKRRQAPTRTTHRAVTLPEHCKVGPVCRYYCFQIDPKTSTCMNTCFAEFKEHNMRETVTTKRGIIPD
jgi:hypothetical protein